MDDLHLWWALPRRSNYCSPLKENVNHWPTKESNTEEGPSYQIEDEEGPVQTKQQEESTDMEIATMVEGRNKSNNEIGFNKLTAFDGS